MKNNQAEIVYEIIRAIPRGKVVTYKQLAKLAGVRNPRQIGFFLHRN